MSINKIDHTHMKKLNNINWHTIPGIEGEGSMTRGHFHDDPLTTLYIIKEVDAEAGDGTTLFLVTGVGIEPSFGHPGIHLCTMDESKEHAEAVLYTWLAVHARQVLNTVVDFLVSNELEVRKGTLWQVQRAAPVSVIAEGSDLREVIQDACNLLGWKGKYGDDESPVVRFHSDVEERLEGVAKL